MASASYFSSAFPEYRSSFIHSALHSTFKKRKRESGSTDDYSSKEELESPFNLQTKDFCDMQPISWAVSSTTHQEGGFSHEIAKQYRTAGQPFGEDPPGGHFPHASDRSTEKRPSEVECNLDEELATLHPPLFVAQGQRGALGLKRQHVADLVTLMHRCLLREDYVRAGRAWSMLLRTEVNGHPMDPRKNDRWGVGAEILLRCNTDSEEQQTRAHQGSFDGDCDHGKSQKQSDSCESFTKENVELARDYYERLILQYPYRKVFPNATSALDFYPAMFGLWIYSVQKQRNDALNLVEEAWRRSELSSRESFLERLRHGRSKSVDRRHVQVGELHKHALASGREIATRLDELLTSPPYSDDIKLWNLVGMVALWIGDLEQAAKPSYTTTESGQSMSIDTENSRERQND